MSEVADSGETWLERVQSVALLSSHAYPTRSDAGMRTPETIAGILNDVEQGASFAASAAARGISRGTITNWRKEDPEFDRLCKTAAAQAYSRRELKVANDKDWKAQIAWLRARKHVFAEPDWQAEDRQAAAGLTVNITLRQDDIPLPKDVTPKAPVLEHDE